MKSTTFQNITNLTVVHYTYTADVVLSHEALQIRGNYFHDIPTIGVYPDNFSWGVEISHNLLVNVGVLTNRAPIFVNGGGECRTFNNIAVDCPFSMAKVSALKKNIGWNIGTKH